MKIKAAFARPFYVELGRDECGGIVEGLVIEIIAEVESGKRWAHEVSFNATERAYSEEGFLLARPVEGVAERAEAFAARIEAKGEINLAHWVETSPAYGSSAWGLEDEAELERLDREAAA